MERLLVLRAKIKKKIKSLVKNLLTCVKREQKVADCHESTVTEPVVPESQPTIIKVSVLSDDPEKLSLETLEDMLKELLSSKKTSKSKPKTPHILVTDEPEWFYDPVNRQMVRVHPGTELILSDPAPDNDGKVMCYCDLGFIMVPFESISELGYN